MQDYEQLDVTPTKPRNNADKMGARPKAKAEPRDDSDDSEDDEMTIVTPAAARTSATAFETPVSAARQSHTPSLVSSGASPANEDCPSVDTPSGHVAAAMPAARAAPSGPSKQPSDVWGSTLFGEISEVSGDRGEFEQEYGVYFDLAAEGNC